MCTDSPRLRSWAANWNPFKEKSGKKISRKKVFKAPSRFFFGLIWRSLKQIASDGSLLLNFEHVKGELLRRVDGESAGAAGEASIYVWRQQNDWGKVWRRGRNMTLQRRPARRTWADKMIFCTLDLFRLFKFWNSELRKKQPKLHSREKWISTVGFYRMKRPKNAPSWV